MKRTITILALFAIVVNCRAQYYTQTHKEIEYNFGVIDEEDYPELNYIEKIKYELRQEERTVQQTINNYFQSTLQITIDQFEREEAWMNLTKRYVHTPNGSYLYDANDSLLYTIPYTQEEEEGMLEIANNIEEYGHHPGIIAFPSYSSVLADSFAMYGIYISNIGDTVMQIQFPDGSETVYNSVRKTIVNKWYDEEENLVVETNGYIPYAEGGYLLQIRQTERFVQSVNGPCVTEVQIIYYKDYVIEDNLGLIDKAFGSQYAITISPNPTSGVFTVSIEIPWGEVITSTVITNLITGVSEVVNYNNDKIFTVDMTNSPDGNYVIKVFTNNRVITTNFIKSN